MTPGAHGIAPTETDLSRVNERAHGFGIAARGRVVREERKGGDDPREEEKGRRRFPRLREEEESL